MAIISDDEILVGTVSGLWSYPLEKPVAGPRKIGDFTDRIIDLDVYDGSVVYAVLNGLAIYRIDDGNVDLILSEASLRSLLDPETRPTFSGLADIEVVRPSEIYASGDQGTILYYDGEQWSRQATPYDSLESARPWIWEITAVGSDRIAVSPSAVLTLVDGDGGPQWERAFEQPSAPGCVLLTSTVGDSSLLVGGGAPPCAFRRSEKAWRQVNVPHGVGTFGESNQNASSAILWSSSGLVAEFGSSSLRFYQIAGGRLEGVHRLEAHIYFVTRDGLLARWRAD